MHFNILIYVSLSFNVIYFVKSAFANFELKLLWKCQLENELTKNTTINFAILNIKKGY